MRNGQNNNISANVEQSAREKTVPPAADKSTPTVLRHEWWDNIHIRKVTWSDTTEENNSSLIQYMWINVQATNLKIQGTTRISQRTLKLSFIVESGIPINFLVKAIK